VEALRSVRLPILVVQGSRDSLGPLETLQAALEGLPDATIAVVDGGDHSYRAAGGREVVARLEDEAIAAAVEWLGGLA
jgi:pimeloyl-ACP methyl ester carboxylesterase